MQTNKGLLLPTRESPLQLSTKEMWSLSRFQHSDGRMPSRDRGKSLSLHLYNDVLQEMRVVCFIQTFTLTSRSLHLPMGDQLISSMSFEMFGCQPFFFPQSGIWFSPFSDLSVSTFLIPSSSAFLLLRRMLFFVIQSQTCCSQQFKYLSSCLPDFLRNLSLTKP